MDWDLEGPVETPWRTLGSAQPRDWPAEAAARRRSTCKAYAEESLEKRTSRNFGAAAWTSRRRWTRQPWEPMGDAGGNVG